jgi:hypothetical protein
VRDKCEGWSERRRRVPGSSGVRVQVMGEGEGLGCGEAQCCGVWMVHLHVPGRRARVESSQVKGRVESSQVKGRAWQKRSSASISRSCRPL